MADIIKILGFLLHFIICIEVLALEILHYDVVRPLLLFHIDKICKYMILMLLWDSMLFAMLYALCPLSGSAETVFCLLLVIEGFASYKLGGLVNLQLICRAQDALDRR